MLYALLQLYWFVVLASVILSWLPIDPENPIVRFVRASTEPVLEPIRKVLPPVGGFDLSPMLLLIGLQIVQRLLPY
jgi:YggT family protein